MVKRFKDIMEMNVQDWVLNPFSYETNRDMPIAEVRSSRQVQNTLERSKVDIIRTEMMMIMDL